MHNYNRRDFSESVEILIFKIKYVVIMDLKNIMISKISILAEQVSRFDQANSLIMSVDSVELYCVLSLVVG